MAMIDVERERELHNDFFDSDFDIEDFYNAVDKLWDMTGNECIDDHILHVAADIALRNWRDRQKERGMK